MDAHVAAVRATKLSELTTTYEVLILVIVPCINNIIYGQRQLMSTFFCLLNN